MNDLKIFYKYYKDNLEYINIVAYPFSHFKELWNTYSSTDMRIARARNSDMKLM